MPRITKVILHLITTHSLLLKKKRKKESPYLEETWVYPRTRCSFLQRSPYLTSQVNDGGGGHISENYRAWLAPQIHYILYLNMQPQQNVAQERREGRNRQAKEKKYKKKVNRYCWSFRSKNIEIWTWHDAKRNYEMWNEVLLFSPIAFVFKNLFVDLWDHHPVTLYAADCSIRVHTTLMTNTEQIQ